VKHHQLARVVLWMSGALLSFSAMALGIRNLSGTLTTFEILALRTGCGILAMVAIGIARPKLFRSFTTHRLGLQAIRNGTHIVAQYLWTASITLLPLAAIFALEFTTPAWTTLLAVLFLGERLTASRVGAVILGISGVLLIVRPGLATFQLASAFVLAAAFGYAITYITTKKLTTTESTFAIILWMNIMQFPIAYAASDPLFFLRIHTGILPGALAVGFGGLSSHYCLTKALSAGDASVVIPFDFLRLPLIALLAWLIYREPFDPITLIGGAVIFAGVLWNVRAEARPSAKRRSMG
jgi:drug/metabolite transporter (DMT)-like permease